MGFGGPIEGLMFSFIPIFIFVIFAVVIIGVVVVAMRGISTYFNNNNMPKESVPARLISKRTHTWSSSGDMTGHTSYYATFEFENGERVELPIGSSVYGLHAEGDVGILTHQGTRFYSFERERV